MTADEIRALADQIEADERYGQQARLLIWAVLTGISQRMDRDGSS